MEGTVGNQGRGAKFWLIKAPLAVALILSGAIGFVIGLALPRFRRGDRTD